MNGYTVDATALADIVRRLRTGGDDLAGARSRFGTGAARDTATGPGLPDEAGRAAYGAVFAALDRELTALVAGLAVTTDKIDQVRRGYGGADVGTSARIGRADS